MFSLNIVPWNDIYTIDTEKIILTFMLKLKIVSCSQQCMITTCCEQFWFEQVQESNFEELHSEWYQIDIHLNLKLYYDVIMGDESMFDMYVIWSQRCVSNNRLKRFGKRINSIWSHKHKSTRPKNDWNWVFNSNPLSATTKNYMKSRRGSQKSQKCSLLNIFFMLITFRI